MTSKCIKNISKFFSVFWLALSFIFLAACNNESKTENVAVSLNSTALSHSSLNISINQEPSKIGFSSASEDLKNAFGLTSYDFYTISLSGLVSLDDAKINAIPTKADGSTLLSSDDESEIEYFTDYLSFSFKVQSDIRTIKIGATAPFVPIDKNRLIEGNYYLNFKYLNLSSDKLIAQAFDYGLDNFIYIETHNNDDKTLNKFIVKLSYDLLFI